MTAIGYPREDPYKEGRDGGNSLTSTDAECLKNAVTLQGIQNIIISVFIDAHESWLMAVDAEKSHREVVYSLLLFGWMRERERK